MDFINNAFMAMDPLADSAPYSLENFIWLMDHSAAKNYLSEESLNEIDEAYISKDEDHLRSVYPVILEQFVRERDISINFALAQESLMSDFISNVEEVGHNVKRYLRARNRKIEAKEKEKAEDILEEINEASL